MEEVTVTPTTTTTTTTTTTGLSTGLSTTTTSPPLRTASYGAEVISAKAGREEGMLVARLQAPMLVHHTSVATKPGRCATVCRSVSVQQQRVVSLLSTAVFATAWSEKARAPSTFPVTGVLQVGRNPPLSFCPLRFFCGTIRSCLCGWSANRQDRTNQPTTPDQSKPQAPWGGGSRIVAQRPPRGT